MSLFSFAGIESKINRRGYDKRVSAEYDTAVKILNDQDQPVLTREIFEEFGICTLRDLNRYLSKHAEYGGCVVILPCTDRILIPFHNDFMNQWLRFDNPRVRTFYHELYNRRKDEFDSEIHFRMKFFEIEEELQYHCWVMPPVDRRMLAAPINGCWDKPELMARFLELQGYRTKRLCCHDGHEMRGHCFTVYTDGAYWMTTSSFPLRLRCRSYTALCRRLLRIMRLLPIYSDRSRCVLVEYEPPREGMTGQEYVDQIINGKVVATGDDIHRKQRNNK